MDNSALLSELKKSPSSEKYEKALADTLTDGSLCLELIFDYVNFLTQEKKYDQIVKVLSKALEDDILTDRETRLQVANKLLTVLLKIEDFVMLKQILDHRADLIDKESDFLMQKFYYAVAYEGLNDNLEAINILENIKDNISNQNLVNKYLKLSMLYLKIDNYEAAKKHYQKAVFFDRTKKNHAFLLAECDLLMHEQDYLKALAVYQDYFIKTNNKYRYLDRYINIQIALNQPAEAYSFYQKHLPIMKRVLSRQSRLAFYQAALKLMKKLNNHSEEAIITALIKEIEENTERFANVHDFVLRFIDNNYNLRFTKEREIIQTVFKEIDYLKLFEKLVHVKLMDGTVKINHYTKGLLLERNVSLAASDKNVFAFLVAQEYQEVYDAKIISTFSNDLFLTEKTKYIFVKKMRDFDYLVFYLSIDDFYNAKKIFDYAIVITNKLIQDFNENKTRDNLLKNLTLILEKENLALILLKENNLRLLNEAAKELLETEEDYMSMEDFQSRLVKNVYVDELLGKDSLALKYQGNKIKTINFKIFKDEMDLYLLGEILEEKKVTTKFYDYKFITEEVIKDDVSVMMFNLRNYHDFFRDYTFTRYDETIEFIYHTLKESSRNYFQNLYLEGLDNFYLLLKTKDKRISKRIYDELTKSLDERIEIRVSQINIQGRITKTDLEDLKYLNSLTTSDIRFLADSKAYRTNKEVAGTILVNAKKILLENNIRLSYQFVVDWQTSSYEYLFVDILHRVLLGNKPSLKRVLQANNLENAWDQLLIKTLVKDVKLANVKAKFIFPLSLKTLLDKDAFKEMKKRLNQKSFHNSEIIYAIDYEEYRSLDIIELPKERLAFFNVFKNFAFRNITDLNQIEFLIFSSEEAMGEGIEHFLKIAKEKNLTLIFDHQKTSLTKSFLVEKSIKFVMGEAYAKIDNLKLLKSGGK